MLRKIKLDGLEAELSTVNALLAKAAEAGDFVGKLQFSKRKQVLETDIEAISHTSEKLASVALLFGGVPVLGSRGISADFAGNALENFQDLVAKTFAKSEWGSLAERGPIPLRDSSHLMITEVARGSFGFVLNELSEQTEIADTALKLQVEEVATLLQRTASPNELDFEEAAESLDSRVLTALKNFFVTLDSNGATLRVVEDVADFTLDEAAIHRGRRRTEATQIQENDLTITGTLTGVLPDHRKFEAKAEDNRTVYGTVSKEGIKQFDGLVAKGQTPIGKRWNLKIRRRVIAPWNRPSREINTLLEFVGQVD
ncbi:MAG: hypothetical protein OJF52_004313 [Nitrospira sp.]|jgi:hypothetical protein|nr:MAG: hypothetical protein OJF52_004313 [Nitrospira sp.]